MKKILLAIILGGVLVGGMSMGNYRLNEAWADESLCPDGTTYVTSDKNGEPLCKINPTGCPYGDSIPMEQCGSQIVEEKAASQTVAPVVAPKEVSSCR